MIAVLECTACLMSLANIVGHYMTPTSCLFLSPRGRFRMRWHFLVNEKEENS